MLNILFLCKNGQVIRSNNLLYMKKSKKNKSQCLRSDGGRSAFFGNKSMLAAIGMLCLSPVFSVAFATGSDALHQMGGSTQGKEGLQQQKRVTGTMVDQHGG